MARTVETLLSDCIRTSGSQSALARRLGINAGDVNEMVNGRRQLSPCVVVYLCDVLALDREETRRLAAEAIVLTAKESKRALLRRTLGVKATDWV